MKAFVTGGTGFLGGRLAEKLRERGDAVVCLVRSPGAADRLRAIGCELVQGDLADAEAIARGAQGCDATFHCAADYRVGLSDDNLAAMRDANVEGTRRVLTAAHAAGVARIVYVSTLNVYGDTRGAPVDERHERGDTPFASKYEQTKHEAHRVALELAAAGAPVVIVQPGAIYGKGDASALGQQLLLASRGKLPGLPFPAFGINWVHVDDVVDGMLLAAEKGRVGESYNLAGENATLREAVSVAARAGGRRPPRFTVPTGVVKLAARIGPLRKALGIPPNADEVVRVMDGTIYASHDKAARELGFAPRGIREGFPPVFGR